MSEPKYFKENYSTSEPQNALHCRDTQSVNYYAQQLFDKACAHYEISGMPDTWDMHYVYDVLFHDGHICFINPVRYGVIPQRCTLYGFNVFLQPTNALVANPLIDSKEYTIGKDTEVVYLNATHEGIDKIVLYYANLMAITMQTYAMNQINTRKAAVFNVNNKQQAETMKKFYDQLTAGQTAAFVTYGNGVDKPWDFFSETNQYVGTNILADLKTIEDRFLSEIGVQNANTQKRERLITSEVQSINSSLCERSDYWCTLMNLDFVKVNKMFGLNLRIRPKEPEIPMGENNGDFADIDNNAGDGGGGF